MRLPAPFRAHGEHIAVDLPGGRALFTTRRGGVSAGAFRSLNLGRTTPPGDADDAPGLVARNREILAAAVGPGVELLVWGHQVHGTRVALVEGDTCGSGEAADGQATARHGVGALVLVADCLPIALAAPGGVAMVHAGWRGLAGGIIGNGVRALSEITGGEPAVAAVGPGAGGCCYEVGEEVHAALADVPHAHRGPNLDLACVARAYLERAGVQAVHEAGLCTICSDPELFFSHRRDRGVTGRQGGVVWRT